MPTAEHIIILERKKERDSEKETTKHLRCSGGELFRKIEPIFRKLRGDKCAGITSVGVKDKDKSHYFQWLFWLTVQKRGLQP